MSENKRGNAVLVGGFIFTDEAEAKQAEKEAEGVKYIKGKTDMDNPQMVLHIYNKMIQQKLFETAVGYSYLKDLQEYLRAVPFIRNQDILPIPVQHPLLEQSIKSARRTEPPKKTKLVVKHADYRRRYRVTGALSVILSICIVVMFAITATTNNTTILNYENELINKYEAWEQELSEREAAVEARERAADAGNN